MAVFYQIHSLFVFVHAMHGQPLVLNTFADIFVVLTKVIRTLRIQCNIRKDALQKLAGGTSAEIHPVDIGF